MKNKIDMFSCHQGEDYARPTMAHAMLAMEVKGIWRSFSKIRESASLSYEKMSRERTGQAYFHNMKLGQKWRARGLL